MASHIVSGVGEQRSKSGDWLVDNDGDIYTVDGKVFAETYRKVKPGIYIKTTPVWAEVAPQPGSIRTREGQSHFQAGDYLVYNNEDGTEGYCMTKAKFEAMYELDNS